MSLDPSVLDALVASGATAEMIVAAVKADAERTRERRAKEAARKAKQRADLRGDQVLQSPAKSLGLNGTSADNAGLVPPKERSPTPPKEITPPTSLRSEDQSREAVFVEFKSAYPRKPGAPWQAAREKLFRLLRDGTEPSEIIDGTRRFAASKVGEDPQFICAPTVFLNQRRWLDEHEPADQRPQPRAGPRSKPSVVGMWTEDILDEQRNHPSAEASRPALAYRG